MEGNSFQVPRGRQRGKTMVDSIGGFNPVNYAASTGLNRPAASSSDLGSVETKQPSAAETFKKYMAKSPMERMIENWLKAHKLDEEKLKAMSPEEREGIMKQMHAEIEQNLKNQTEKKGDIVDVVA
jgi:hypothetical protein